jgi:hypothetical protein
MPDFTARTQKKTTAVVIRPRVATLQPPVSASLVISIQGIEDFRSGLYSRRALFFPSRRLLKGADDKQGWELGKPEARTKTTKQKKQLEKERGPV